MAALLTHYEKPVYNVAFRMLGNTEDAADVTQTVFLKVFQRIRQYDPGYRFFSWIYRIAVNESIDQLAHRKPSQSFNDDLPGDDAPPDTAARDQLEQQVQQVMAEMSDEHRAVVVLRYFTDCDYRQISVTLGIPEKTVRSRLFEARRQMRGKLHRNGMLSP